MRIGVLGAGAMGLTAAYRLANAGHDVVVFEKQELLGGLAAGFPIGQASLERFYHHLFQSDRTIVGLIDELGLSDRMIWAKPNTSMLVGGKAWELNSPATVLKFAPLPFVDRIRLGAAIAYLKINRDHHQFEHTTALKWIRRFMGKRVSEVVWEPQLRSKFDFYHERVSMAWFWARIFCRTPQLGYMRGGFQQFYESLGSRIRERGGDIRLSTEVTSIASDATGVVIGTDRGEERFDQVMCTLPTRLFARLSKGLPSDWLAEYDWGDWLGAHCVILALDRPLTDVYWLSINDPGYPYMALVEHTNFAPMADYDGLHPIYLGNYLPMSSERYTQSDESIVADYLPSLKRINPSFDPSWIKKSWVFKAPFAQPVVTQDYPRHIPPHTTPLPNVFLANMFQVYPQDRGQNYSVKMAEEVVKTMLAQLPE